MTPSEMIEIVRRHDAGCIISAVTDGPYPHVVLKADRLKAVAGFLKADPRLRFDLLRCICATDRPATASVELSYDLISTAFGHSLALKVILDRAVSEMETVSTVWPAAEWHEREAFDLVGVTFLGHPDLRRILLPDDWTGYPLRKDYQEVSEYKGLKLHP